MGLITAHGGSFGEYEAVALPPLNLVASRDTAVFLRRSARPSRRAVLHLDDLRGSFAPADMARWYNERGFHFYVTDLDVGDPPGPASRRRPGRPAHAGFVSLDAARQYLREAGGIDAIILSAQGSAAWLAARWCDARRSVGPVDALILSDPDFGRVRRDRLNIGCPVLVISVARGQAEAAGKGHQGRHGHDRGDVSLGQHVTWLNVDDADSHAGKQAGDAAARAAAAGPNGGPPDRSAAPPARRRLFDEMGRWLGAYMYGQVRDQLL